MTSTKDDSKTLIDIRKLCCKITGLSQDAIVPHLIWTSNILFSSQSQLHSSNTDEFYTAEKIKKKLADNKRENDIVKFAECHRKLCAHPNVLINRGAVLKLLYELSNLSSHNNQSQSKRVSNFSTLYGQGLPIHLVSLPGNSTATALNIYHGHGYGQQWRRPSPVGSDRPLVRHSISDLSTRPGQGLATILGASSSQQSDRKHLSPPVFGSYLPSFPPTLDETADKSHNAKTNSDHLSLSLEKRDSQIELILQRLVCKITGLNPEAVSLHLVWCSRLLAHNSPSPPHPPLDEASIAHKIKTKLTRHKKVKEAAAFDDSHRRLREQNILQNRGAILKLLYDLHGLNNNNNTAANTSNTVDTNSYTKTTSHTQSPTPPL